MGHIRLGQLPRSRKWRDVVELVAAGADVAQVASATINAADEAFTLMGFGVKAPVPLRRG